MHRKFLWNCRAEFQVNVNIQWYSYKVQKIYWYKDIRQAKITDLHFSWQHYEDKYQRDLLYLKQKINKLIEIPESPFKWVNLPNIHLSNLWDQLWKLCPQRWTRLPSSTNLRTSSTRVLFFPRSACKLLRRKVCYWKMAGDPSCGFKLEVVISSIALI